MGKKLIIKKFQKVKAWYTPPKVLINWRKDENGDFVLDSKNNRISTSEEYESDWGELFFDLIYVAMAFKLGDLILEEIEQDQGSRGLLFFLAIYTLMHDAWLERAQYMSRYGAVGMLHQFIDIFEAMAVAAAAAHITIVEDYLAFDTSESGSDDVNGTRLLAPGGIGYYNYASGFSVSLCVFSLIQFLRGLEVRLFCIWDNDSSDRKAVRNVGTDMMILAGIRFLLFAATILTSRLGLIWETVYIWIFGYFSSRIFVTSRFYIRFLTGFDLFHCTCNQKYSVIPYHVSAIIKRYGEWTMLMLGEGVLQIIILAVTEDHEITHNLSFALSFAILALVQLTDYKNMPFETGAHVMRRNGIRAIPWFFIMPLFAGSLIWVGVGLKSILKYHYKLNDEKEDLNKFAWLLCGSLASCFTMLFYLKALHPGFRNIIVDKKSKFGWTFSFVGSLSFLVLPLINIHGTALLAICVIIIIFLAAVSELTNEYTELEVVPAKFDDYDGPIEEEEILAFEEAEKAV